MYDFNNWTSGNDRIDKIIQDAQLNANNQLKNGILKFNNGKEIKEIEVVKKFDNFANFNDVLNEMAIHLKTGILSIELNKIYIYDDDIVHQDFHPGNILSYGFTDFRFWIKDYFFTGFPPYPDISHDKDLAMTICNGLRPKISFHTLKLITRMIMSAGMLELHIDPLLKNYIVKKYLNRKNKVSEIVIQIKKAEEFSANQESTNTTTTPLKLFSCQRILEPELWLDINP
ncbi:hypothetical protein Glove_185g53 [Diversispora epigaea]|uniref:Protein kinase domain-containing protein n=1 Tax=Diversispora epigaea TaxID=1348612 RepID=A0A397IM90_9GLOM|nr:hypothetical protein Glove_185g53 [Diversispora epigaea]